MLPIDILKIYEGQYLSETGNIENTTISFRNGTPSNSNIFKKLCGLGATHGECKLYNWRNSIIIEPNTPVLIGKKNAVEEDGITKKYPNIFVVYKGVKKAHVLAYLRNNTFPKKILCTPEAYFDKVRPAIMDSTFDLYNDFFMLYDECDRLIKDVDYRGKILLPMNDFFLFKEKAMISATPLIPSDPRFAENGFRILDIQPQFNYRKPITIINTNRIVDTFNKLVNESGDDMVFIFLNSPELIHDLIISTGIEDKSKIFCAPQSVALLRSRGFENACYNLGNYSKFNFFTSRFFNAVDMELDYKPNVIMLTDVFRAKYSKLDPYTDSIQIVGRFRNGTNKITHISSFNPDITFREPENAVQFLEEQFQAYGQISLVANSQTTQGGIIAGNQAIEGMDISKFIGEDLKLNRTMVDNYVLNQKISSHYRHNQLLNLAYLDTNNFLPAVENDLYNVGDGELDHLRSIANVATLTGAVAKLFEDHNPLKFGFLYSYINGDCRDILRQEYPQVAHYYDALGYRKMRSLNFETAKLKKALKNYQLRNELKNPALFTEVHNTFAVHHTFNESEVKAKLKDIYTSHNVRQVACASHLRTFFSAKRSGGSSNQKTWHIYGRKFT